MKKQIAFLKIFLKIFIFAGVAAGAYWLNRSGLLESVIQGIQGLGTAGPFVFLLVYVISAICFVPYMILAFAGGFLFDFWTGAVVNILGSALAGLLAFLIGRYLARSVVEKWAKHIPGVGKISKNAAKKGWKIVLLARLTPIFPFSVANYIFGTTNMRAGHYFFASLAGTIPSALVYTYSGHLAGSLAKAGPHSRTSGEWGLFAFGLAASAAILFYLRRLAQSELCRQS